MCDGLHIPHKKCGFEYAANPDRSATHQEINYFSIERWAQQLITCLESRVTEPFTWSVSLTSDASAILNDNSTINARCNWPLHATNGLSDFNTDNDPSYRAIIPRNGVYSISAEVSFTTTNSMDFANYFQFNINNDTQNIRILTSQDAVIGNNVPDASGTAYLNGARVGVPCRAGDLIALQVSNQCGFDGTYIVIHFDVTYEAELGTVWNLPGGDL